MEKIEISLNSKKDREVSFKIVEMSDYGNYLKIKTNIKISPQDTICFRRYVSSEAYDADVCIRTYYTTVVKSLSDAEFIIEHPKPQQLIVSAVSGNCITFKEEHNIFAQDLIQYPYTLVSSAKSYTGLSMCDAFTHSSVTPSDFVKTRAINTNVMCETGKTIVDGKIKYYIPVKLDRLNIYVADATGLGLNSAVTPSVNEFYYKSGTAYTMFSGVSVTLVKNYYQIPLNLSENTDYVHLMQEENINNEFIANAKASLVPEVIDFEKLKYSPYVNITGDTPSMASSITFNLHFRKRTEDSKWEITGEDWNNSTPGTSDVLGWLNFVDSDVQYQKLKVRKSFIRLSFYTTNDPLTQKLLFYSTVFLDGGELYGKFVKTKAYLKNNTGYTEQVISYTGTPRVDSQIVIKNEYNYDKSSEGFYLYLFASDAPENEPKTIYMKVEFNHAGVGRTFPMIPAKEGVTLENYMENLYIPLNIRYKGGKYMYGFKPIKDFCTETNNNIIFDLYEPILDK